MRTGWAVTSSLKLDGKTCIRVSTSRKARTKPIGRERRLSGTKIGPELRVDRVWSFQGHSLHPTNDLSSRPLIGIYLSGNTWAHSTISPDPWVWTTGPILSPVYKPLERPTALPRNSTITPYNVSLKTVSDILRSVVPSLHPETSVSPTKLNVSFTSPVSRIEPSGLCTEDRIQVTEPTPEKRQRSPGTERTCNRVWIRKEVRKPAGNVDNPHPTPLPSFPYLFHV